jgi:hypothetical protein
MLFGIQGSQNALDMQRYDYTQQRYARSVVSHAPSQSHKVFPARHAQIMLSGVRRGIFVYCRQESSRCNFGLLLHVRSRLSRFRGSLVLLLTWRVQHRQSSLRVFCLDQGLRFTFFGPVGVCMREETA